MTIQQASVALPGGVRLERNLVCPMRDGTELLCDVYRPAEEAEYPVLLMRTPYGKEAAQGNGVSPYAHPSWFASRGYVVVIQDVRGRHASQGKFTPLANELSDGYDTLEWCSRLDGSLNAVGTFGLSYPGFVQLAAAGSGHPSLKCVTPGFTSADAYKWAMTSGLPKLAFVVGWGIGLAMDEAIRQGNAQDAQLLWEWSLDPNRLYGQMPLLGSDILRLMVQYMPFLADWLTNDDPSSEFWQSQVFPPVSVPALYLSGWYDIWVKETIELFQAQHAQRRNASLLVGPWAHVPWRGAIGPDCNGCGEELNPPVQRLLLEWFDWRLKGITPSSWLGSQPACWFDYGQRKWVTGDFESTESLGLGIGTDGLATVSNSGRLVSHPLSDAGASKGEAVDVIVDDPLNPTASVGGWSCCYEAMSPMGAKDQRWVEELSQVAVYTADPLPEGTQIRGKPRAILEATFERLPCTIVTTLCLVRNGRSFNIARGVWRMKDTGHESGWVDARAEFEMTPLALSLTAGDRIRLLVQGSSYPEEAIDPHTDALPARVGRTETEISTIVLRVGPDSGSSLVLPLAGANGGE